MTLTYHAKVERADRFAKLEEVLGFTSIVMETVVPEQNKKYCITSSGILIVKGLQTDQVITAFMLTKSRLIAICRAAGKKQCPPKLMKRVEKNMVRHADLCWI